MPIPLPHVEFSTTIATYDKVAPEWAKTHTDPAFWEAQFEGFRSFLPKGRVIDLGCGAGRDALLFGRYPAAYEYLGIDASQGQLAEARRRNPGQQFLLGDIRALAKLHDGYFDGFWAVASWVHTRKCEIPCALIHTRRITHAGSIGFIAMKAGAGECWIEDPKTGTERFFAFYSREEFEQLLARHRFEILRFECDVRELVTGTTWLLWWVRRI